METVMMNTTNLSPSHNPYYPIGTEIVGYLANEWSVSTLLAIFAGTCGGVLGSTLAWVSWNKPNLSRRERSIILWFVLSGCIHFFFEGYFCLNHTHMGGQQDLFGQLWKEYALSDSRYLTSDPFVLCMESITALCWGPLSLLVAYFITIQHPMRHPLQLIVSLGQIYGDVLYYATNIFDDYYKGLSYSRPEAYYFWGYYFFMNIIWIIIPSSLLYQSFQACTKAFAFLQEALGSPLKSSHLKAN
ncbi:MAG: hypothetical protein M1834_005962 [Cirrosporium novae-zelandiae]|nr:MAG: hypothetical protein M1834_005962 [Cirrosporium novae-zelandiae]